MIIGGDLKRFVILNINLFRLTNEVKDKFFLRKLFLTITELTAEYIDFMKEDNVAQYKNKGKDLMRLNNQILDLVEYIKYLSLVSNTYPLLRAERSLLSFKLYLIERLKSNRTSQDSKQEKVTSGPQVHKRRTKKDFKLNPNKEKILDFIRGTNNIRTRDLIEEFSSLSERTVKRNLKDLVVLGLIKRKVEDGGVYYHAI